MFKVSARGGAKGSGKTASVHAVNDVSLSIGKGETFAIVGESGSGKTTLANMLARVLSPSSGSIYFDGQDIASLRDEELFRLRRRIQMVFQDPTSSLNPRQSIKDIISLPLRLHKIGSKRIHSDRVAELLDLVHLSPDLMNRSPGSLSGGQKQRVNIARALALEPEVLILDEPTSALDVSVQARILSILSELKAVRDLTYVLVTHDLGVVRAVADKIAVMYLGRIVESGSTDQIFKAPQHPYTRALLSAMPVVRPDESRFIAPGRLIDGDIPSVVNPPRHCAFFSRCLERQDVCAERDVPALTDVGRGQLSRCHLSVAA